MSYNANVPDASQTPSLFPPQGSANFNRLKTIINNDHIFNNTAPVPVGGLPTNDGRHRQVTLKNRDRPTQIPTGTDAILYSSSGNGAEAGKANQLFYWDGTTYNQLTPVTLAVPLVVTGQAAAIAIGTTVLAFADPGYKYSATAFGLNINTNEMTFAVILRSGSNQAVEITSQGGSIFNRPQFSFIGNDLRLGVKAAATGPKNITWSINITRVIA